MKIVAIGGTDLIGSKTVPILRQAGHEVVAASPNTGVKAARNRIVEIAGPERAPFNDIVARYLKARGDPRTVVRDPEARYEWLRRSPARA